MKKIVFILLFVTLMCAGCLPSGDFFGATDRAQIRANAEVQIAQAKRDESIGVAHEQASSSRAWAGTLPIVILIIVAGALGSIVVYWQGRIYYEQAMRPIPQLPVERYIELPERVRLAAIERNGYPEWDDVEKRWMIVDDAGKVLARQKQLA